MIPGTTGIVCFSNERDAKRCSLECIYPIAICTCLYSGTKKEIELSKWTDYISLMNIENIVPSMEQAIKEHLVDSFSTFFGIGSIITVESVIPVRILKIENEDSFKHYNTGIRL